MFVPAPGIAQVELIFSFNQVVLENVYNVRVGAGPLSEADLDACNALFVDWFNPVSGPSGKALHSNTMTLQRVEVSDLTTQNAMSKIYPLAVPIAGVQAGSPMPANVCACVTHNTGFKGRSFRGRTYISGLYIGWVSGNQMTAGYQALLLGAFNTLRTKCVAAGKPLVVLSRRNNNTWRTTAVDTLISSHTVDIYLDSQRRRLSGPGRGA